MFNELYRGLSAVVRHYEKRNYSGSLRFSVSEVCGARNIDLCEDTTVQGASEEIPISKLKEICERIKYGWVLVYLSKGKATGFDYKINYQGSYYRDFEKECITECSDVKIVIRKSNT